MEQEQSNNTEKQLPENESLKTKLLRWLRTCLKVILELLLQHVHRKKGENNNDNK